ncbi:hypothetical protein BLTE_17000 [Blastochloris tepida]|uniref:Uncharacterized protein n=1 Tax=Blastochloris tepida TaxID=2233851 RepID=A0A348G0D2_9HYPH|nr:hypothetical protein BLTE_17000 [Blastochloris tepida]
MIEERAMRWSTTNPSDDTEDTSEGWQMVAWTSGAALAFAVLAAMASIA